MRQVRPGSNLMNRLDEVPIPANGDCPIRGADEALVLMDENLPLIRGFI
jgi:hypothetical protein